MGCAYSAGMPLPNASRHIVWVLCISSLSDNKLLEARLACSWNTQHLLWVLTHGACLGKVCLSHLELEKVTPIPPQLGLSGSQEGQPNQQLSPSASPGLVISDGLTVPYLKSLASAFPQLPTAAHTPRGLVGIKHSRCTSGEGVGEYSLAPVHPQPSRVPPPLWTTQYPRDHR